MRPCGTFDEDYRHDMAIIRTRFQWIMLGLLLVTLLAIFPYFLSDYVLSTINVIFITIIVVLGLNILTGYTGQISIGQAAFVGVGAYASAVLSTRLGLPFWICLPFAILVAALIGLIFGLPSLKLKGFYLAMSTLAAQYVIPWIIIHTPSITFGINGCPAASPRLGDLVINSEREWYYLLLIFVTVGIFFAKNIARTKPGRAFVAIRDNDLAAEIMGINIFGYKILSFIICSAYAGLAGSLLAHYQGMVVAEQFSLMSSIWYLGMVIVGGMGSIVGTIFGVVVIRGLRELVMITTPMLTTIFPVLKESLGAAMTSIGFGLVVLLFLIFEPRGLAHRWELLKNSMRIWPMPY